MLLIGFMLYVTFFDVGDMLSLGKSDRTIQVSLRYCRSPYAYSRREAAKFA